MIISTSFCSMFGSKYKYYLAICGLRGLSSDSEDDDTNQANRTKTDEQVKQEKEEKKQAKLGEMLRQLDFSTWRVGSLSARKCGYCWEMNCFRCWNV